uniref:Uncharacterized protein n=1 Tax=Triticum urartu TaxID=4572 RepID=A0A8R7QY14_TRIUA
MVAPRARANTRMRRVESMHGSVFTHCTAPRRPSARLAMAPGRTDGPNKWKVGASAGGGAGEGGGGAEGAEGELLAGEHEQVPGAAEAELLLGAAEQGAELGPVQHRDGHHEPPPRLAHVHREVAPRHVRRRRLLLLLPVPLLLPVALLLLPPTQARAPLQDLLQPRRASLLDRHYSSEGGARSSVRWLDSVAAGWRCGGGGG